MIQKNQVPNNYDKFILGILESPNKTHWKIRKLKEIVETHISGLRLTAFKMQGTNVARWCNGEANRLEKKLAEALVKTYVKKHFSSSPYPMEHQKMPNM